MYVQLCTSLYRCADILHSLFPMQQVDLIGCCDIDFVSKDRCAHTATSTSYRRTTFSAYKGNYYCFNLSLLDTRPLVSFGMGSACESLSSRELDTIDDSRLNWCVSATPILPCCPVNVSRKKD